MKYLLFLVTLLLFWSCDVKSTKKATVIKQMPKKILKYIDYPLEKDSSAFIRYSDLKVESLENNLYTHLWKTVTLIHNYDTIILDSDTNGVWLSSPTMKIEQSPNKKAFILGYCICDKNDCIMNFQGFDCIGTFVFMRNGTKPWFKEKDTQYIHTDKVFFDIDYPCAIRDKENNLFHLSIKNDKKVVKKK